MGREAGKYYLSDDVLARFVQIVQEGMILGIDVVDLMRQVRLVQDAREEGMMTLDPEYVKLVEEMHKKYVADAEAVMKQQP